MMLALTTVPASALLRTRNGAPGPQEAGKIITDDGFSILAENGDTLVKE